jgi:NifU-like protein involved in Fe-S cluster formation
MILEYEEISMFLLNIEVLNIMTPDFPHTSENKTKCALLLWQTLRNLIKKYRSPD